MEKTNLVIDNAERPASSVHRTSHGEIVFFLVIQETASESDHTLLDQSRRSFVLIGH
jgi:hypothetical protein